MEKEISIYYGSTYIGRQLMVVKHTCGTERYVVFEGDSFTVHKGCGGDFINLRYGGRK